MLKIQMKVLPITCVPFLQSSPKLIYKNMFMGLADIAYLQRAAANL